MYKTNEKIFVTKPYLPSIKKYNEYLNQIWKSNILTNNGNLVLELEKKLKELLGVKHLFFVANGTIALQIAIKALDLKGEIITTPFSYVATLDSIIWENCTPIFVDINDKDFCIDETKIEEKITKNTTGILAVHVFGNPANVFSIDKIAKRHNLKVLYDGAHAFGTKINNTSILNFGDISTLSFHATKLFHTVEGGAVITNNDKLAEKIRNLRSFGHPDQDIVTLGINAKNSELHAAMGLSIFPEIENILKRRKEISKLYDNLLKLSLLQRPIMEENISCNYSYYPVVFKSEDELFYVKAKLEQNNIFPRRYFYPSLNTLPFFEKIDCSVSESISQRTLCLPL